MVGSSDNKESVLSWSTLNSSITLLWDMREEIQNEGGLSPKKIVPQNLSMCDCVCTYQREYELRVLYLWCNCDAGILFPASINQRPYFKCISLISFIFVFILFVLSF